MNLENQLELARLKQMARLDELSHIVYSDGFERAPAEVRAEAWEELFMAAFDALLKMEMRAEDAERLLKMPLLTSEKRTEDRSITRIDNLYMAVEEAIERRVG